MSGHGEHVDIAVLDCIAVTMTNFVPVFSSLEGWPDDPGPPRNSYLPGIEPARRRLGRVHRDDLDADPGLPAPHRALRLGRGPHARDPTRTRGAPRRVDGRDPRVDDEAHDGRDRGAGEPLARPDRRHRAPRHRDGARRPSPHATSSSTNPDGGFLQPRRPYLLDGAEPDPVRPSPAIGAHDDDAPWPARTPTRPATRALPLAGIRVVDFSVFWAGPTCTQTLAAWGADVVKVESFLKPDGARVTTRKPDDPRWWEHSALFHPNNQGKRSIGIDLTREEGREIARRLIASADLVVENFTPRVMEQFGFDWDAVHALNPACGDDAHARVRARRPVARPARFRHHDGAAQRDVLDHRLPRRSAGEPGRRRRPDRGNARRVRGRGRARAARPLGRRACSWKRR